MSSLVFQANRPTNNLSLRSLEGVEVRTEVRTEVSGYARHSFDNSCSCKSLDTGLAAGHARLTITF